MFWLAAIRISGCVPGFFICDRVLRRAPLDLSQSTAQRPYIYGLALGVYCTSWTFYGAVGSAVREGWGYLPIYHRRWFICWRSHFWSV